MSHRRCRSLLLVAAAFAAAIGVRLPAQGCATGSDTFWKRDTLPVVPAGLTAVSVIPGLCEGESAGVVFEMPATMGAQRITQVVAPWGAAGGINGFQAVLDVEVYDGVSFNGAVANMGTLVFSLSGQLSANMQVTSHGLNVLDTSNYGIVVGTAPGTGSPAVRRFAVCFRVDINFYPGGSCSGGWDANFFTDNATTGGLTCNNVITPLRTSLIEIQGQGWRDAALATVQGFQLCPLFYRGIWAIRCCSRDAFPASYTTFGPGCPGTSGISTLTPVTLPRLGSTMNLIIDRLAANVCFMMTGFSNQTSTFGSLPLDLAPFGAPGCLGRVSPDAITFLLGTNGNALWSLTVPNQGNLLGMQFYQQGLVANPGINALGAVVSDAAAAQIGN